jgi:hypothetical protein
VSLLETTPIQAETQPVRVGLSVLKTTQCVDCYTVARAARCFKPLKHGAGEAEPSLQGCISDMALHNPPILWLGHARQSSLNALLSIAYCARQTPLSDMALTHLSQRNAFWSDKGHTRHLAASGEPIGLLPVFR